MASKIETNLTPAQLQEFFLRCSQLRGTKLKDIQALAEEFGIEISLMSAKTFRDGAWSEYLESLNAKREMAESVAALAKGGVGLSDGAASVFAQKVFDAAMRMDPEEIGGKAANNLSLAIARLRTGDQRASFLEAKLAEMERKQTEWEEQRQKIAAETDKVRTAKPADADEVRAAAVAEIDRIMGINRK